MKINSYTIAALPKLDDRLIGTSVDGVPLNGTYNFTPAELLALYEANFNAPAIVIANTPVYADNAAALLGGLVIGQIYRTGDYLKIVH
tara:strand:+ start:957 stop:1220 length:264 start_codon:yes stop_codon:yes gene_type:complete